MNGYRDESEIDLDKDEFGPGVDLMAALFAVVVIIATFLGLDPELNEATVLRSVLEQRDRQLLELEAELATLRNPGAPPTNVNWNALLEERDRAIRNLEQQIRESEERAAALELENSARIAPLVVETTEAAAGPLFEADGSPTASLLRALAIGAATFRAEGNPGAANALEFEIASSATDGVLDADGRDGVLATSALRAAALESVLRSAGLASGCLRFEPQGLAETIWFSGWLVDRQLVPDRVIDGIRDEQLDPVAVASYEQLDAPSDRRVTVRAVLIDKERCDPEGLRADLDRLARLVPR
ncbi:hypothetical protein [Salinarimonas rosea]|uniref:hypothetical protein n=1 Tax=Salinarimonas rosea TaxID=552063 RepID=UPI00040C11CF|nr:hypothetical protein [Salinarimonas rosea]